VVRCIRGALFDMILDLRPDSPTFGKSFGAELNAENRLMMYVPRGFAHGLLTLTEETEAFYLVSNFYAPEAERGVRWNDPEFVMQWPAAVAEVSPKDGAWPDFDPQFHAVDSLRNLI
jgi:dTDP-4-dehydrorhamnose 3,5-epimerase